MWSGIICGKKWLWQEKESWKAPYVQPTGEKAADKRSGHQKSVDNRSEEEIRVKWTQINSIYDSKEKQLPEENKKKRKA